MKKFILSIASICLCYAISNSQVFTQKQKLTITDSERRIQNSCGRVSADQFGYTLSIDSTYMAIGANMRDQDTTEPFASNTGSVYIYQRKNNTWVKIQEINVPDASSGDNFGSSLKMKGDWLYIGSPNNDFDTINSNFISNSGSVYVFKKQNQHWTFVQKIVPPVRASNDRFGHALDLGINYAIIGVPNEDEDTTESNSLSNSGSAYIYKLNNGIWQFDRKIMANGRASGDNFGFSVSIYDSTVAVGCIANKTNSTNTSSLSSAGSVHIYKRISGYWRQVQKIVPSDRASSDQFGQSVCIDSNRLAVGSFKNNNSGRVYIFKDSANLFRETHKISSKDLSFSDKFGSKVVLKKNKLIVGAPEEDHDTSGLNFKSESGSAYLFSESGGSWKQIKKLTAKYRNNVQYHGAAIDLNDSFVFIGAYGTFTNENGVDPVPSGGPGAVYTYELQNIDFIKTIVLEDNTAGDEYGTSIDANDSILVIGSPNEDEDSLNKSPLYNSGAAFIYKKKNNNWEFLQKIQASDRRAFDQFGSCVSVFGEYIFVGARSSSLDTAGGDSINMAGSVYVYKSINGKWKQIQKICAFDRSQQDWFGHFISADSNFVAISSIYNSKDTLGNLSTLYAGAVYIYKLDTGRWIFSQKIKAPDAAVNDFFGYSLDINNQTLMIGSIYSGLDTSGLNKVNSAGSAYIYKFSGSKFVFNQKLCADQRNAYAYFGNSVYINDSVAFIGANSDSRANNTVGSGSVFIYKKVNNKYILSQFLNGTNIGAYYQFGNKLTFNDSLLFISAVNEHYSNGVDSFANAGIIYCYKDSGNSNWKLFQKFTSEDISNNDFLGSSIVSINNSILTGAIYQDYDINGKLPLSSAGAVYEFKLENCYNDTQKINVSSCDSFISPSKKYIWKTDGIYYDLVKHSGLCDSIFEIHLNIGSSLTKVTMSSCDPYKTLSGNLFMDTSGIYFDTLKSYYGCDSIIEIHFKRLLKTQRDTNIFSCKPWVSVKGQTYSQTGIYYDTLTNYFGCDSIIRINFIKGNSSTKFDTIISCKSFLSATGRVYDSSGLYIDTISNYIGCDSIIFTTFKRQNIKETHLNYSSCYPFQSQNGKIYTISGLVYDTLSSYIGCDSIIITNFTRLNASKSELKLNSCAPVISPGGRLLNQSGYYNDTLINFNGCDSIIEIEFKLLSSNKTIQNIQSCQVYYHSSNNTTYTKSVILTDTLTNFLGCDSIVEYDIEIILPEFDIILENDSLKSNLNSGTVTWYYCDSGFNKTIHTGYYFKPIYNNKYQAIISKDNCKDTSKCIEINNLNLSVANPINFDVYPNPVTDFIIIESRSGKLEFNIINYDGQILLSGQVENTAKISMFDISPGLYIIQLKFGDIIQYLKIVKQ